MRRAVRRQKGRLVVYSSINIRDLRRLLRDLGCVEVRRRGSHLRVRSGPCWTTVPATPGEDLRKGLLASIQRDLAPHLGRHWLTRPT